MSKLDRYIEDLAKEGFFDTAEVPEGGEERFLEALEASREEAPSTPSGRFTITPGKGRRLVSQIILDAFALAAALALFVVLSSRRGSSAGYFAGVGDNPTEVYSRYQALVRDSYERIYSGLVDEEPGIQESLSSLTEEAVPYEDLLPEEFSAEQKAVLMKEYYSALLDGMETFEKRL